MRPALRFIPWWLRIRLVELLDAWCIPERPGHDWLWRIRVRLMPPMTIERARRIVDGMLRLGHETHPLPQFLHPVQPGGGGAGSPEAEPPEAVCDSAAARGGAW